MPGTHFERTKITVFLSKILPTVTKVQRQKFLDFNKMLAFYMRGLYHKLGNSQVRAEQHLRKSWLAVAWGVLLLEHLKNAQVWLIELKKQKSVQCINLMLLNLFFFTPNQKITDLYFRFPHIGGWKWHGALWYLYWVKFDMYEWFNESYGPIWPCGFSWKTDQM